MLLKYLINGKIKNLEALITKQWGKKVICGQTYIIY